MKIYGHRENRPFPSKSKGDYLMLLEGDGKFFLWENGDREPYTCYIKGEESNWKEIEYPPHWPNAEKYRKEKQNNIYTKVDSAAREFVKKMAEDRGIDWGKSGSDEKWTVWTLGDSRSFCQSNDESFWWKSYKEVPLHEFIFELGKIPETLKEKEINILPWKVVVRGEKCDFGCKKDVSVKSVKIFLENLPFYYGNMYMLGKMLSFGKNGFQVDGETISWETLEKFAKEFEK